VLKATNQKTQKSLKRWYNPPSLHLNVNVMPSNITFLMIFAGFDPSPLIQWINCIFSINICCFIVMCNVSLCNYKVYLSKPGAMSVVCGCLVVCAFVTHNRDPNKAAGPIEVSFEVWTPGWVQGTIYWLGALVAHEKGQFGESTCGHAQTYRRVDILNVARKAAARARPPSINSTLFARGYSSYAASGYHYRSDLLSLSQKTDTRVRDVHGSTCVTRSNPTHQLTDPTQPDPLQEGKFVSNPKQPNTTNHLTAWCNQILSNRDLNAFT